MRSVNFTLWQSNNYRLWQGDFFALPVTAVSDCQLIYDRAALIALPAGYAATYVANIKAVVAPAALCC